MHGSGPYCPAAQTTWEATAMTFSPLSLKVLVITFVIAALAGGAVAMTRPKPIDSAVLGSEWQCHEIAFVVMTCALRTPAAGSACVADRESRSIHLCPGSIAGKHVTHLSSNLGPFPCPIVI